MKSKTIEEQFKKIKKSKKTSKKKGLIRRAFASHIMSKKLCSVCNKKINIFSKIFSKKCKNCGSKFHLTCGIVVLDHLSFINGEIKYISSCCSKCAEKNSIMFNENRYCSICNQDISTKKRTKYCEVCRQIGHDECYKNNANMIDDDLRYIYPYLYNENKHGHICKLCLESLYIRINDVKSRIPEFVNGTRNEYIRGYNTIKTLGRIEYNGKDCSEPSEVEEIIELRAIQLGGNAYVKFYWEKHTERHSEEYLAGHSKRGNPYYKTRYWTEKWFTGYATSVVV